MNLNKVDLNLFVVFDAIYTEANLTRAGQIIGITQPAVSNALARLRESFNDPLFVRTAQGMVPTPMAQNIISPVRSALALLRVSVQESRTFNPLQANKTFRISMTDLTEAVVLPPLFQRLRKQAPSVVIESFLAHRRETTSDLAAGRLDFAIDAPLNTDPQVRHVKLMEDRYVCAMRAGHPLASQAILSLDAYLALTHIHISTRRNGLGQVDLALGKNGLATQNHPALAALLDGLQCVATHRHGHDRARAVRTAQCVAFCGVATQRDAQRGNPFVLARKHRARPGQPLDARIVD